MSDGGRPHVTVKPHLSVLGPIMIIMMIMRKIIIISNNNNNNIHVYSLP